MTNGRALAAFNRAERAARMLYAKEVADAWRRIAKDPDASDHAARWRAERSRAGVANEDVVRAVREARDRKNSTIAAAHAAYMKSMEEFYGGH